MKAKMHHCFWCGVELGVYQNYWGDEPECCGKQECQRELRDVMRQQRAEARERAEEDNYSRYGGV